MFLLAAAILAFAGPTELPPDRAELDVFLQVPSNQAEVYVQELADESFDALVAATRDRMKDWADEPALRVRAGMVLQEEALREQRRATCILREDVDLSPEEEARRHALEEEAVREAQEEEARRRRQAEAAAAP